jgi:zinc/manganese transport system substrate-binding protein
MVLRKALLAATLALASLSVAGCTSATQTPLIVSGVSQWGALASALVGSDAKVVSLLTDPNADPHEHEATVSDAVNVTKASVVLVNGAGYDTWLSQLISARSSHVSVINVAKLMGVDVGKNPHLFYNPTAAVRFVEALTTLLEHRSGFSDIKQRSATLLAQLDAIQRQVALVKKSCAKVPVAATEDVTTYLLVDMGLKIVTPEALRLAVGNGVDPTVQNLALALEQLRHHPAFLVDNIQTATPLTDELVSQANSSHVPVIKVTETMTGTSYVKWLGGVVKKIDVDLTTKGCLK